LQLESPLAAGLYQEPYIFPIFHKAHCDGDASAQLLWQDICWLPQLIRQELLALALLVLVAAPVGAEPGTIQDAWQVAHCALQLTIQLVVVELCAT
jgi:hypothetical protein